MMNSILAEEKTFLAGESISQGQTLEEKAAFEAVDTDKDGVVSKEEYNA